MSYTNADLVEHFVNGGTSGKCNRMAIEEDEENDATFLWGYGHALYAARLNGGDTLVLFNGWYGYSTTTSQHLNLVRRKAKAAYGEPKQAGENIRVQVSGDGVELLESPPAGRAFLVAEEGQPAMKYGTLKTEGWDLLDPWTDRRLNAPSGLSG